MKEKFIRINTIEGYKDIKDQYWISNSDEDVIINKDTRKQLKPWLDKDGYSMVGLMTKNDKIKKYRIHILKAKAFLFSPNPLGYNVVRHLNDCKTDNRLINLAWGTMSDNTKDCIRNGKFNYEAAAKNGKKTSAKNFAKCRANSGHVRGGAIIAKKYSKPIRCIETGVIYLSTRESERILGIHHSSISSCCRGGRCKTAGGFHWEFVNPISES